MKRVSLSILLLLISASVFSQYLRSFSLYNYDPKLINPAYAGLQNEQNYQVQYAANTKGYGDSTPPYAALTGFSLQLTRLNSGIGGFLWKESVGVYTEDNASFLYNYQVKLGDERRLSIGSEIRRTEISLDYSKLEIVGGFDPLLSSYQVQHDRVVTADFGVVYNAKAFSVGASTQNLVQSHKQEIVKASRYYSFYSAYQLPIRPWLAFKPSIFLITGFTGSQSEILELNTVLEFKKIIFIGARGTISNYKNYMSYNAGITIAKRVQLIGVVYSGIYHDNISNTGHVELMLRVVIPRKTNVTQN